MLKININSHLIEGILYLPSDIHDIRPYTMDIDAIIIHCISLPEGSYGNEKVSDLFKKKASTNKN